MLTILRCNQILGATSLPWRLYFCTQCDNEQKQKTYFGLLPELEPLNPMSRYPSIRDCNGSKLIAYLSSICQEDNITMASLTMPMTITSWD